MIGSTPTREKRRSRQGHRVVAVIAVVVAGCGAASSSVAPRSGPPDTRASIPAPVEAEIHASLHELPRLCNSRKAGGPALERSTAALIRYYRRYPSGRFALRIDGESGSMLSVLLVVRQRLAGCSPRLARTIDRVLPPDISRALRPPRRGSAR